MKQPTESQERAIRIAVAELAGAAPWLNCYSHGEVSQNRALSRNDGALSCPWCKRELEWMDLPDYTRDLNALHEVVAILSDFDRQHYACTLSGQLWHPAHARGWNDYRDTLAISEATALQRCMALLETLAPDKLKEIMGEEP